MSALFSFAWRIEIVPYLSLLGASVVSLPGPADGVRGVWEGIKGGEWGGGWVGGEGGGDPLWTI